jgi:transposase
LKKLKSWHCIDCGAECSAVRFEYGRRCKPCWQKTPQYLLQKERTEAGLRRSRECRAERLVKVQELRSAPIAPQEEAGAEEVKLKQVAHKIQLFPTKEQEAYLWRCVRASRNIWNWGVVTWKDQWKAHKVGKETGADIPKPSVKYLKTELFNKKLKQTSREDAINALMSANAVEAISESDRRFYVWYWGFSEWETQYRLYKKAVEEDKEPAFPDAELLLLPPNWKDDGLPVVLPQVSSKAFEGGVFGNIGTPEFTELGEAFSRFIKYISQPKAMQTGPKVGEPKWRKVGRRESFCVEKDTFPRCTIKRQLGTSLARYLPVLEGKHVWIPVPKPLKQHVGEWIRMREELREKFHDGEVNSLTFSHEAGKWWVSIQVGVQQVEYPRTAGVAPVGCDLGMRQNNLATLSTGEQFPNPQPMRHARRRLRRLQRELDHKRERTRSKKGIVKINKRNSREVEGSNTKSLRQRIAKLHAAIATSRDGAQHQLTAKLVSTYAAIMVEDLKVSGMMKNKKVARMAADTGLNAILTKLRYKSEWSGAKLMQVGKFDPSSKTCFGCGEMQEIGMSRRYVCPKCHWDCDRDRNAALNLLKWGAERVCPHCEHAEKELSYKIREYKCSGCGTLINCDENAKASFARWGLEIT